ncbi:MAG: DNA alkylation repair protein, partial [Candidatus Methanomethylophilaceae archaeon]|nr:DNA alkylation repair protein [Candidatus Methanomethylophilaceae archaeon]
MDVRKELLSLRDDSNAEFAASLTPCEHRFLGARIPALRKLAKRIASEDWRGYIDGWEPEYFEDYMLRGLVIAYAKVPVDERLRLYDEFIPLIDNWSVCDSLCSTWKPKKDEKGPLWDHLIECLRQGGEFRMRFAVVMMMNHFLDDEHVDDVLRELDSAHDDGYYLKMGVAWCLATCLAKYPERTMAYMEGENGLDEDTRRMAIRKALESYRVDEGVKSRLRAMRRYRFLSLIRCPRMDKTAKAYIALAIAVPSILTVWCLVAGYHQAS